MAYTITLDKNLTIIPKDGFIIKDELNETLDSGTIVFSTFTDIGKSHLIQLLSVVHLTTEMQLPPLDKL